MANISPYQIDRTASYLSRMQGAVKTAVEKAGKKATSVKTIGEAVGAAALVCAARGYVEKRGQSFVIPGIGVDGELAIGLALAGVSMFELADKYNTDVEAAAIGVLSHYVGQATRNSVKAGTVNMQTLVAGDCIGGDCVGSELEAAISGL